MQRYHMKLFFPTWLVWIFFPSLINLSWCVSLFENSFSVFENWCSLLVFPATQVILSFFYTAWKLLTCKHSHSHSWSSWCIFSVEEKKKRINGSNICFLIIYRKNISKLAMHEGNIKKGTLNSVYWQIMN